MQWWNDDSRRALLDDVLAHCNAAKDSSDGASPTHVCDLYFHALNKYWNAFNHQVGELARGDISSFVATLRAMPSELKATLLEAPATRNLVALSPPVMNHDVLKKRGYVPKQEISESLQREATEEHRKTQKALTDFDAQRSDEVADRALKRLAELLYVIRSNIAHGEKTPYGPDLEKAERDRFVCATTVPVQALIIDLLFGRPSRKLVAYGTLQPGASNSELLAECVGTWEACTMHGELVELDGLPIFRYRPTAPHVSAMLLTAQTLERFWRNIDRFEGKQYVRHLIPVRTANSYVVAHVYEHCTTVS